MVIDILLVLALPASGKSEIRRYLESLSPRVAHDDFHLGPTIQVDDYPYVHLMRRVSQEQRRLGVEPAFFSSDDDPFREPGDWLTLIHLLAEDVAGLGTVKEHPVAAEALLERLLAARARSGVGNGSLAGGIALATALAPEAAAIAAGLPVVSSERLAEATIVVEFARGGPVGMVPPLPHPLGYLASLPALGTAILERASILWVVTDPEESRRRNRERTRPGPEGDASTLHHGVPEAVMAHDYGMDDLGWLLERSPVPGTIAVDAGEETCLLPVAQFDNRTDRTSFLRDEPVNWSVESVAALHRDLSAAFGALAVPDTTR